MESTTTGSSVHLPRVAITFCTQCKWMLRAAYFGQELLSTFGTSIGEIALIPSTGGIFTVDLSYGSTSDDASVTNIRIWDRKAEGGFPETKILKQRVRNHIEPEKKLGHSDTPASKAISNDDRGSQSQQVQLGKSEQSNSTAENVATTSTDKPESCEDCA